MLGLVVSSYVTSSFTFYFRLMEALKQHTLYNCMCSMIFYPSVHVLPLVIASTFSYVFIYLQLIDKYICFFLTDTSLKFFLGGEGGCKYFIHITCSSLSSYLLFYLPFFKHPPFPFLPFLPSVSLLGVTGRMIQP